MVESWLLAGMASTLHTSPHGRILTTNCIAACCFLSQTSWQSPFQTAWLLLLSLTALSYFKWRPRISYVTSYPASPTICYFCRSPCIFYLLLAAIYSQGKGNSSLWCRGILWYKLLCLCHEPLNALKVWGGSTAFNLSLFCKVRSPYYPLLPSPNPGLWGICSYFQGPLLCAQLLFDQVSQLQNILPSPWSWL